MPPLLHYIQTDLSNWRTEGLIIIENHWNFCVPQFKGSAQYFWYGKPYSYLLHFIVPFTWRRFITSGDLSMELGWQKREPYYPLLCSDNLRYMWGFNSTPLHDVLLWCIIKHCIVLSFVPERLLLQNAILFKLLSFKCSRMLFIAVETWNKYRKAHYPVKILHFC
jgi:hypothetical protein